MLRIAGLFALAPHLRDPDVPRRAARRGGRPAVRAQALEPRVEPWLWQSFHVKPPHTMSELDRVVTRQAAGGVPDRCASAAELALFGTLSYVAVILSALIVPVFALYLLIDFDRIMARARRSSSRAAGTAGRRRRAADPPDARRLRARAAHRQHRPRRALRDGPALRRHPPRGAHRRAHGDAGVRAVHRLLLGPLLALTMAALDWHGLGTAPGRPRGDARRAAARRDGHHAAHRRAVRRARAARGAAHDDGGRVAVRLPRRAPRGPARRRREDPRPTRGRGPTSRPTSTSAAPARWSDRA